MTTRNRADRYANNTEDAEEERNEPAEEEPPHEADRWFSNVRSMIADFGLEHSADVLRFSLIASADKLLGIVDTSFDRWSAKKQATELAHIEGQLDITRAALAAEADRLAAAERTRRYVLLAISTVTVAAIVAGIRTRDLGDVATVVVAFASLVKLVVGDTEPGELSAMAHTNDQSE
jgi:hypothetical protein